MTSPMAPGQTLPPVGPTRLVAAQAGTWTLTARRETDARSALIRGVAEYIEQLEFNVEGGRQVRFKKVLGQYAEPEALAKYPSCAIFTSGAGAYDASKFTPSVAASDKLPAPETRYAISPCDYVQDLIIEVWANDPKERAALVTMLEEAFNPVTWRYGFVLELPYYFNQRAAYDMKDLTCDDSDEDAVRRYRRARFTLGARVPLTKLVSYPLAKPRFDLAAIGDSATVLLTLTVE